MGDCVRRGAAVALALMLLPRIGVAEEATRSFAAPRLWPAAPAASATADTGDAAAGSRGLAQPAGVSDPSGQDAGAAAPMTAQARGPAAAPPATAPPPEAGAVVRPGRQPTPQWPLTAQDLADKRLQRTGAAPAQATAWPASEVVIAKARCVNLLKDLEAVYVPLEQIREGECGTPAPVQLMAVGKSPQVVISPPAIVTCDMVAALHEWLRKDLQPSARRLLGSPIVKIENMSSYSCRNAYGRARTRLSEHGRANALDIRGFVTASGQGPELLADWGPTERDVRAAEVAAARAAAARAAAVARTEADRRTGAGTGSGTGAASAPTETGSLPSAIPGGIGTLVEGLPRVRVITPSAKDGDAAETGVTFSAPSRLGGPKPAAGPVAGKVVTPPGAQAGVDRKQQFLRDAHTSACRIFKTVLGPEANNAHRNHFHIDMAERASGPFCE